MSGTARDANPDSLRIAINNASPFTPAVAVRPLPTGSFKVSFATIAAANQFTASPRTITKACGNNAAVKAQHPRVIAHNFQFSDFDLSSPAARENALKTLASRNTHLHGFSTIGWNTPPRKGKRAGALVVGFASPSLANKAINEGIGWGNELHRVETWNTACKVTQCYRCAAFGHATTCCAKPARCRACAGPHETKDCDRTKNAPQCANCEGKHVSWNPICPTKASAARKAAQARAHKPLLFPTGEKPAAAPQCSNDGWIRIGESQKRKSTHDLGSTRAQLPETPVTSFGSPAHTPVINFRATRPSTRSTPRPAAAQMPAPSPPAAPAAPEPPRAPSPANDTIMVLTPEEQ